MSRGVPLSLLVSFCFFQRSGYSLLLAFSLWWISTEITIMFVSFVIILSLRMPTLEIRRILFCKHFFAALLVSFKYKPLCVHTISITNSIHLMKQSLSTREQPHCSGLKSMDIAPVLFVVITKEPPHIREEEDEVINHFSWPSPSAPSSLLWIIV